MAPDTDQPSTTRYVDDGSRSTQSPLFKADYDSAWAAVIGIDDYAHYNKLRFAAADAVAMARVLIEHRGFPSQNVFLVARPAAPLPPELAAWQATAKLGTRQSPHAPATRDDIHDVMDTLRRAQADDRVLIYFAGHGVSRSPVEGVGDGKPYLAPIDAQLGNWRTHIDLKELLDEGAYLKAKHVFYVFDACCSGLADQRASDEGKRFERRMLRYRARQCLTAGTKEQRVDDRGDGDHSPFTGQLLRLLGRPQERGQQDVLGGFMLAAQIRKAVGNLDSTSGQTPTLFTVRGHDRGDFMFSSHGPPLTVEERAGLARLLVSEVGRPLDEPAPIAFAAALWQQVLDEEPAGTALAREARRERGHALLLQRDAPSALHTLDDPALRDDADAALLRAVAALRIPDPDRAITELTSLAHGYREHPYAGWARRAAEVLRRPRGRRFALLIGVCEIPAIPAPALRGCDNDVAAMQRLLQDTLGFDGVTTLIGEAATCDAIRLALDGFVTATRAEDSFVCYISGSGYLDDGEPVYPSYDQKPETKHWLRDDDFDRAMRSIPAFDKVLITDGCYLAPASSAVRAGYRFLHACRRDERSWEMTTPEGTWRGAFTYALETAVRELRAAPIANVMARIKDQLSHGQRTQTPGYTDADSPWLIERRDAVFELIEIAEQSHRPYSTQVIESFASWLEQDRAAAMAPLWLAIGHARLARRDPAGAIAALTRTDQPSARLALLRAQLLCDRYGDAFVTWTRWCADRRPAMFPAAAETQVVELGALLDASRTDVRRALLVMTRDDTTDESGDLLAGVRDALIDRFGVPAPNIEVLRDAPRVEIIAAFRRLAQASLSAPAFVLFIGPGFDGAELWLSTADGHRRGSSERISDLSLSELRPLAPHNAHLTAAMLITSNCPPFSPSTGSPVVATGRRDEAELGIATLTAAPPIHRDIRAARAAPDAVKLVDVLALHGSASFTLGDWQARFKGTHGLRIRGAPGAALLPYTTTRDRALAMLRCIEQAPLKPLLAGLARLTEHPELAADAWLQIAIAQEHAGHPKEAHTAVKQALDLHDRAEPPSEVSDSVWPDAHYHRGRILLALKQYSDADAAFKLALEQQPSHARAHYYRAKAIRALIEADLEQLERDSLDQYRRLGAPLGVDDEVDR